MLHDIHKQQMSRSNFAIAKSRVSCLIRDDGIGFETKTILSDQSRNGGLGLALARERIEAQGGTFEAR